MDDALELAENNSEMLDSGEDESTSDDSSEEIK